VLAVASRLKLGVESLFANGEPVSRPRPPRRRASAHVHVRRGTTRRRVATRRPHTPHSSDKDRRHTRHATLTLPRRTRDARESRGALQAASPRYSSDAAGRSSQLRTGPHAARHHGTLGKRSHKAQTSLFSYGIPLESPTTNGPIGRGIVSTANTKTTKHPRRGGPQLRDSGSVSVCARDTTVSTLAPPHPLPPSPSRMHGTPLLATHRVDLEFTTQPPH
jgi:hypothetical protein